MRCDNFDPQREVDSIVHSYDREVGFKRHNQAAIDRDEAIAAAYHELRNDQAKFKSHVQRVETFNLFERYVLERHPDHEYASYLGTFIRIMDEDVLLSGESRSLAFMPPPEELVVTYAMNLRKDKKEPVYDEPDKPDHVYGTIKKYIGAITGTCVEFHARTRCRRRRTRTCASRCTSGRTWTRSSRPRRSTWPRTSRACSTPSTR